eukprot:4837146-Prymnesium_polylepis.1
MSWSDMWSEFTNVLGLSEEQAGKKRAVEHAYRKLSVTCHPDKNSDPDAKARFQKLSEAKDFLVAQCDKRVQMVPAAPRATRGNTATSTGPGMSPPPGGTVQSNPLGSNPVEVVGNGGCVAVALYKVGLFESLDEATAALDEERERYRSKVRDDQDCEAFLGVRGESWHREIIARTVLGLKKWDYRIVPKKTLFDKPDGIYLVDGIANWRYQCRPGKWEYPYELDGPDDRPWRDRKNWQHVIGINQEKIMRKHKAGISMAWLWMSSDGSVDKQTGFMYEIHKVYAITPKNESKKRDRED